MGTEGLHKHQFHVSLNTGNGDDHGAGAPICFVVDLSDGIQSPIVCKNGFFGVSGQIMFRQLISFVIQLLEYFG